MKFSANNFKRYKVQKGLSLVELMVSLVIGMAVMAGSIQVVVNSKRDFLDQGQVQFIQTNARYALDLMSKDIRMAGYLGCTASDSVSIANSIADNKNGFISMSGLQGFEGSVNTDSFPADYKDVATVGTDSFIVRHASAEQEFSVKLHNPFTDTLEFWDDHEFTEGSTLVIADAGCRSLGLFQVSGFGAKTIFHDNNDGGSSKANNCTNVIKGNFNCASSSCGEDACNSYTRAGVYGNGATVRAFVSHAYYVAPSTLAPGLPALRRQVLDATGAVATFSEEVALGVEDFEVTYGVDADADGNVDQFRSAEEMDLNSDGLMSDDEWDQVLNIKVALVFRSQNPVLPAQQLITLLGVDYNDRFTRQLVNTTIRVRNRG